MPSTTSPAPAGDGRAGPTGDRLGRPTGDRQAGTAGDRFLRDAGLLRRRRLADRVVTALCFVATLIVLAALASILWTLVANGIQGLSWRTLTHVTAPAGENGGLLNPIVGSIIQVVLATLVGTPIGLMAGIYLAEYGAGSHAANAVRFVSDMLLSAPSILVGLFVYLLLVAPFHQFSGFAGVIALAILVIPIVVRTTEDMLRLVPVSMREAAAALGAPRWKVVLLVCVRAARAGLMTGVLLAIARISGETAPLLFTSLGNLNWSLSLGKEMASLPVTIYQYAGSPSDDWVQLAWTAALLITAGVLLINIIARVGLARQNR